MRSIHGAVSETYQLSRLSEDAPDEEQSATISRSPNGFEDDQLDEEHLLPTARNEPPRWTHQTTKTYKGRFQTFLNIINGSTTLRALSFQPIFPKLQALPSKLVARYIPGTYGELAITLIICVAWALTFGLVIQTYQLDNQVERYGDIIRLSCSSRLWPNSTFCGLNGVRCEPFDDGSFAFRCPASCANEQILEPHVVGNQELNYQHYVIGGSSETSDTPGFYRGDSFICPAAIHAGIITDRYGGCGILHRTGEKNNFSSSSIHGISSVSFLPRFPLSFTFERGSKTCHDPQWLLLGSSVVATCLISIFVASPAIFYSATFYIVHFQVALASEAPYFSDFAEVVSAAFGRLLPSAGIGFVIYHHCVRRCIGGLEAPFERTLLWIGFCWVGALNKYTFDQLPISRLTPHDLQQQPGAMTALVVVLTAVVAIAVGQAWAFKLEGRLLQYVKLYSIMGLLLTCLAQVPGLDLRIHHYIIALLLLPGTSLQTRPSLAYQGVLVGLFINGIARWDFASLLQTPAELLQDGLLGSAVPQITASIVNLNTITFSIESIAQGFDGISILVNDVERFQTSDFPLPGVVNWTRQHDDEPVFFRFAFTARNLLGGFWYGDFTKPDVWWQNGTWTG